MLQEKEIMINIIHVSIIILSDLSLLKDYRYLLIHHMTIMILLKGNRQFPE